MSELVSSVSIRNPERSPNAAGIVPVRPLLPRNSCCTLSGAPGVSGGTPKPTPSQSTSGRSPAQFSVAVPRRVSFRPNSVSQSRIRAALVCVLQSMVWAAAGVTALAASRTMTPAQHRRKATGPRNQGYWLLCGKINRFCIPKQPRKTDIYVCIAYRRPAVIQRAIAVRQCQWPVPALRCA